MIKTIPIFLSCWVGALCCNASSLLKLDLDDLARRADYVVSGTIEAAATETDEATGLFITVSELKIDEIIEGQPPDRLEVVTFGGRVGEIRQVVEGEAELSVGEQVVLFLRKIGRPGRVSVVGMFAGKFQLVENQSSLSVERSRGMSVVDHKTGDFVPAEVLRFSLDEFKTKVRGARRNR